ncbi:MAG: ABC transporter permease, partial [Spirochaetota bacterium]
MWNRIWTIFVARNKEFFRDRASFLWNLAFPLLIILGFGMVFSNGNNAQYKVGYIAQKDPAAYARAAESFLQTKYIEFVPIADVDEGQKKLSHHRIDMLISFDARCYWISKTSPKSYIAEKLLAAAETDSPGSFTKK